MRKMESSGEKRKVEKKKEFKGYFEIFFINPKNGNYSKSNTKK